MEHAAHALPLLSRVGGKVRLALLPACGADIRVELHRASFSSAWNEIKEQLVIKVRVVRARVPLCLGPSRRAGMVSGMEGAATTEWKALTS